MIMGSFGQVVTGKVTSGHITALGITFSSASAHYLAHYPVLYLLDEVFPASLYESIWLFVFVPYRSYVFGEVIYLPHMSIESAVSGLAGHVFASHCLCAGLLVFNYFNFKFDHNV